MLFHCFLRLAFLFYVSKNSKFFKEEQVGFEPTNNGFADRSLNHLGTVPFSSPGRNRTGKVIADRGILSPLRIPISPLDH